MNHSQPIHWCWEGRRMVWIIATVTTVRVLSITCSGFFWTTVPSLAVVPSLGPLRAALVHWAGLDEASPLPILLFWRTYNGSYACDNRYWLQCYIDKIKIASVSPNNFIIYLSITSGMLKLIQCSHSLSTYNRTSVQRETFAWCKFSAVCWWKRK